MDSVEVWLVLTFTYTAFLLWRLTSEAVENTASTQLIIFTKYQKSLIHHLSYRQEIEWEIEGLSW